MKHSERLSLTFSKYNKVPRASLSTTSISRQSAQTILPLQLRFKAYKTLPWLTSSKLLHGQDRLVHTRSRYIKKRARMAAPIYSPDFLRSLPQSAPEPTISKIDFAASGIPQYADSYALVIDNLFTVEECAELVSLASQANNNVWERALVNIGGGKQASYPDIRNCGRIIFDSTPIAELLWTRVKPYIPTILRLETPAGTTRTGLPKKANVKIATGLNERLRFLRYGPGEFFERHFDGCFSRKALDGSGKQEFSMYTLHLYLNDGSDETEHQQGKRLVGGSTSFFSPWDSMQGEKEIKVKPKVGRVLVFQQAGLMHSGEEVLKGLKLTMRTDIMYQTVS